MRTIIHFIFITVSVVFLFSTYSPAQFVDNFEYYFPDEPVACQKPQYWTTWSFNPCDPEDPFVSTDHSYSGSYSLKIVQNNNLVKLYDEPLLAGIDLVVYIPSGKSGYFNILSRFSPNPVQWGLECYFDAGGTGRLIHGTTDNFSWTPDTWHYISIYLELPGNGQVYFSMDGNLISTWDWTQGGTIDPTVEGIDFFGATANDEMYVDDFDVWDGCLSCLPPNPAANLTAEEILNPDPAVKLNWENNSFFVYEFYVVRKDGYPNDPGEYQYIGGSAGVYEFIDSLVMLNQRYSYGIVSYGRYGYADTSNFVTILVLATPVELTSFRCTISSNKIILLWLTATETNNRGFEVERKLAGDTLPPYNENEGWQKIGFVEGNGTTTSEHSYTFSDTDVLTGKYLYRLKQIDLDGHLEYSNEIEAEITAPDKYFLEQNYPNPFNPATSIGYSLKNDGFVSLKIYNILGQEAADLVHKNQKAGYYTVSFNASELPSGVYIYTLSASGYMAGRKMLLIR